VKAAFRLTAMFGLVIGVDYHSVSGADVGTAFTYQGFLEKPAGIPVDDTCDFRFSLYAAPTGGSAIGDSPQTVTDVTVTRGTFTMPIDFGAAAVDGTARWLAIEVQCSDDADFVPLDSQRVELTPAPYSIRAGSGVGGPDALNVTPSGDVGIGTTTAGAKLDVNGATRTTTLEIMGGTPLVQPLVWWGYCQFGDAAVPIDPVISVAAGVGHALAIRNDGTLVGWGANTYGQINVPSGTFVSIAAGYFHSLAIRSDGTLVGWGWNDDGQTNVPSGTFAAVAAGYYHSLALRTDGTLIGWGRNDFGQADVPNGSFVAVAGGESHGLAIRNDGTLAGWGRNDFGQANVPDGTFIAVDGGDPAHSLAIRSDGTLVGWGDNTNGQTNVPSGTFTALGAGYQFSVALRDDGTLAAWGSNTNGYTNVPSGTFTSLGVGYSCILAIRSDPPPLDAALRLYADSALKPGSNTWTIWSDRRLKKNIEPLSGALDRLLQLRGATFNWLNPATQGGITGTQMGLIADEVARVFPQWVGRDAKGYQTLTVGGFEALTTEAFRELRAEKDRQLAERDCELETLRSEIAELKRMIGVAASER